MTIGTEITRIKTNIENAYTALGEKGATIPEVQNSANLAETIGSVKSGGGGSNKREADFDTVDKYVNEYNESNQKYVSIKQNASSSAEAVIGLALIPNLGYIYLNKTHILKIAIPDSATIEDYDNNYKKLIFSGNEYWFCATVSISTITSISSLFRSEPDENSGNLTSSFIKYINVKNLTGMSIERNFSDILSVAYNVCDFKSSNIIFTDTISKSLFYKLLQFDNIDFFFENAINVQIDDVATCNLLGLYSFSLRVFNWLTRWKRFPFIVDLSEYNNSTDINFNSGRVENGICTIKIILPSICNIDLGFCNMGGNIQYVLLTRESWEFIAEHSPEVEDKTLKMGKHNIRVCGGEDSEIITTLKNKGWTIA